MRQKIIRTLCQLCHGACGILAYVADGKLIKAEGDPDFPTNKGALCPTGLAATQLVYHPIGKRVGLFPKGSVHITLADAVLKDA